MLAAQRLLMMAAAFAATTNMEPGPLGVRISGRRVTDTPDTMRPKISLGRNAACHCGSGKKFKKCCLNK